MPKLTAVRKVIDAAGGPVALAKKWDITYAAVNTFERQGFLPLRRARQAVEEFPGVAELRELVREDIRAAMDQQHGDSLLR